MINNLVYETLLDQKINLISNQRQHLHSLLSNDNSNTIIDNNLQYPQQPYLKMNIKRDKNLPKIIKSIDDLRNHVLGLNNPLA